MTFPRTAVIFLLAACAPFVLSEPAQSVVPDQETYTRMLEEALEVKSDNDERSLLGFGGDQGEMGDRCGGPYDVECNTEAGLSCTQSVVGQRCLPSTNDCIRREMRKFQSDFGGNVEEYKSAIFAEANVTEVDIFEARRISKERGEDDRMFSQSAPVKSLIAALKANPGKLIEVEDIAARCDAERDAFLGTTGNLRRLQENATTLNSTLDLIEEEIEEIDTNEEAVLPVEIEESTEITEGEQRTHAYIGFHLEGGALFDSSLSFFWNAGGDATTYIRGCVGFELGGGAELSFQVLLLEALEPSDIDCTSILVDFDVSFTVSVGSGLGLCYDREVYYDFTIGLGVGGGLGVSVCNIWDI